MRSQTGQLFLIDFGIARRFRPGVRRDTTLLGSPGYAAPEQYGQFQTSPQTDIYSLGITLWQLLSGQDPTTTVITQKTVSLLPGPPALSQPQTPLCTYVESRPAETPCKYI
jgi:serine/threonine protein kinase